MELVMQTGNEPGKTYSLDRGEVSLGRQSTNDIVIFDEQASRKHATVRAQGDGTAIVTDLGSSNGTKINGQRINGAQAMRPGDTLQIGNTALVLQGAADEAKTVFSPQTFNPASDPGGYSPPAAPTNDRGGYNQPYEPPQRPAYDPYAPAAPQDYAPPAQPNYSYNQPAQEYAPPAQPNYSYNQGAAQDYAPPPAQPNYGTPPAAQDYANAPAQNYGAAPAAQNYSAPQGGYNPQQNYGNQGGYGQQGQPAQNYNQYGQQSAPYTPGQAGKYPAAQPTARKGGTPRLLIFGIAGIVVIILLALLGFFLLQNKNNSNGGGGTVTPPSAIHLSLSSADSSAFQQSVARHDGAGRADTQVYRSSNATADVLAFYRAALPGQGYSLDSSAEKVADHYSVLRYTRGTTDWESIVAADRPVDAPLLVELTQIAPSLKGQVSAGDTVFFVVAGVAA